MNEYYEDAVKRLDKECNEGKFDRYAGAMKTAVRDALKDFCRQDDEFAQAVVQGGSFEDCMKAVAKCVKNQSISDMEAFGAAVKFYFPGAGIDVAMTINLCASVEKKEKAPKATPPKGLILDLSDFF